MQKINGVMNAGTASEAALAVKAGKPVILVNCPQEGMAFFKPRAKNSYILRYHGLKSSVSYSHRHNIAPVSRD